MSSVQFSANWRMGEEPMKVQTSIGMPTLCETSIPGVPDPVRIPERLDAEAMPRYEFEDGAGGADPDALAAPGSAGMIRVPVAADDDLAV